MGFLRLELGVLVAIVALNLWATAIVRRQSDLPESQRHLQLLFVWVLPVIGAVTAIEVHRRLVFRRPRQRLVAEEIHPIINDALRPLADGMMRVSEKYFERELLDFGHDFGHDIGHGIGGDGGHAHGP